MRTVYFDCFCGISGDMILGSLLDLGADLDVIRSALSSLPLTGYELHTATVTKGNLSARSFSVQLSHQDEPRTLSDILAIIEGSSLSETIKEKGREVFSLLARAEASVHGVEVEQVHFHEVGATDSIVDIIGSLVALENLAVQEVYASKVHLGRGHVVAGSHVIPIPAPATLRILEGVPVYSHGLEAELVTPTGAAILRALARRFGPMPSQRVLAVGCGAGQRDLDPWPNILRAVMGETLEEATRETVTILQTNIDDMNPENYQYIMEKLMACGANDVFLSPIHAKKGRPGVLLTAQCDVASSGRLIQVLFEESTTFGIRIRQEERVKLDRESIQADTPWGKVSVKVGKLNGNVLSVSPEYEDCRAVAERSGVALKEVYDRAKSLVQSQLKG